MAPPVDPFRDEDPGNERRAHDDPGVGTPTTTLLLLRRGAAVRLGGRRDGGLTRLLVRRCLAVHACLDQAGLHPPEEVGVLGERIGELRLHAFFARHAVGEVLDLARRLVDSVIRCAHFLTGGSSPVNIRQMPEAVRRPISAARAVSPATRPVQSSFRSMTAFCTSFEPCKPAYVFWSYAACEAGSPASDRERRLAETRRNAVRAPRCALRGGLRGHAGDHLA